MHSLPFSMLMWHIILLSLLLICIKIYKKCPFSYYEIQNLKLSTMNLALTAVRPLFIFRGAPGRGTRTASVDPDRHWGLQTRNEFIILQSALVCGIFVINKTCRNYRRSHFLSWKTKHQEKNTQTTPKKHQKINCFLYFSSSFALTFKRVWIQLVNHSLYFSLVIPLYIWK